MAFNFKNRLRIFDNRVLREMFWPEGSGKTTNQELFDLYCSPNITRVIT